ncbi:MAG: translation initiation factor IF-3, partial [Alphaproteobacteria bacterium]|nr:translation initiation factor IF-3 [Alphaproteobacteria bacterium]
MNEHIAVDSVRLIDGAGEQVGVVNIDRALDMAAESGLDLVEISPGAEPPVCKLMDYGKYKYEAQKKAAAARKKQKTIDVKEVKFRPGISSADYDVKLRN